jgi:hypothetical protein
MPIDYKTDQGTCKEIVLYQRRNPEDPDEWKIRVLNSYHDEATLYRKVVFISAKDPKYLYWADRTGQDHTTPYNNIMRISKYNPVREPEREGGKRKSKKQTKSKKSKKSNKSKKNKNQRK